MSTILKALQRLEQDKESSQPSSPTPVFSKPQATRSGLTEYLLNPWSRMALAGILVLVFISVAAVHFYHKSGSSAPKRAHPRAAPEISAPVPGTYQTQPRSFTPLTEERLGSQGIEKSKQADIPGIAKTLEPRFEENSRGLRRTADAQTRNAIRQLPQSRADGTVDSDNSGPYEDNGDTATASEKSEPEKIAAPDPKAPSDAFESTPILTDGRLKVHAIAWSARAEERMAVVNNRVVYEGDSMDSFIVVAIRPDDVVVREKEKGSWRVVFGRP